MKVAPRVAHVASARAQRRVLIVDDHPIVRQGLRRMIEAESDLVVCGEVQTEKEARAAIRALVPDVVIVDISLAQGDGLELVRDVHAQQPELPMLVLSMHDELIFGERLLAAGASGYIMKQAASEQLLVALRRVLGGGMRSLPADRARGLGLKIMRYRAQMLGGDLVIESKGNGGTTVRCSCPLDFTIEAGELQVLTLPDSWRDSIKATTLVASSIRGFLITPQASEGEPWAVDNSYAILSTITGGVRMYTQ